ncbi:hypothetical protein PYCC9005_003187 [Savitreella phatthalungensis]
MESNGDLERQVESTAAQLDYEHLDELKRGRQTHRKRWRDRARWPGLDEIPYPIAHFLGHRTPETSGKPLLPGLSYLPTILEQSLIQWIGVFAGLSFIMILFSHWDIIDNRINGPLSGQTPIVIGSFGASSVIVYGAPNSPFARPRSFFGGQLLSALVGICITKLFALSSHYNVQDPESYSSLVWVAGGVATATAVIAMMLTKTVHPPGGATALLAATSPPVVRLSWSYLAVVLISCLMMKGWALFWLNLGSGRFPDYWWSDSKQNDSVSPSAPVSPPPQETTHKDSLTRQWTGRSEATLGPQDMQEKDTRGQALRTLSCPALKSLVS